MKTLAMLLGAASRSWWFLTPWSLRPGVTFGANRERRPV